MSATSVTRTSGVAGTFEVTFNQAPTGTPTITVYTDIARTIVAVATANLVATASPLVWTASYPSTLAAATYYLSISAVYTVGQPAKVNADDALILTDPSAIVGSVVTLAELKTHLDITVATFDTELTRFLNSAAEVVADIVGPLTSVTVTRKFSGGQETITLPEPTVTAITAATYSDGTVITPSNLDLDVRTGIVHWAYNTAGSFTHGNRNVTLTYMAGFATTPSAVKLTVLELAAYWWRQRKGGSDTFLPAGDDGGGFRTDAGNAVPGWVASKLRPYTQGQGFA